MSNGRQQWKISNCYEILCVCVCAYNQYIALGLRKMYLFTEKWFSLYMNSCPCNTRFLQSTDSSNIDLYTLDYSLTLLLILLHYYYCSTSKILLTPKMFLVSFYPPVPPIRCVLLTSFALLHLILSMYFPILIRHTSTGWYFPTGYIVVYSQSFTTQRFYLHFVSEHFNNTLEFPFKIFLHWRFILHGPAKTPYK
jgi:hypothetical protein